MRLVKSYAPPNNLSKRETKFRKKPWFNGKIQKMMHIRDRLLRDLKTDNNQSLKDLYKTFTNQVDSLRVGKACYLHNYFQK